MAAPSDPKADRIVPQMTTPATAAAARMDIERNIESFSTPVLTHLKQIYESLSQPDSASSKEGDAKSGHHGKFDRESVSRFLENVQRDHPTVAAKSSSLRKFLPKKVAGAAATGEADTTQGDLGHGDLDDFLSYMASPASNAEASVVDPATRNLKLPLSNYFISSSHNTYLTGNQLYGESSTDAYKNVLLRGCRCLEIDVWDGDLPSDTEDNDSVDSSDEEAKEKKKAMKRNKKQNKGNDKSTGGSTLSRFDSISNRLGKMKHGRSNSKTTPEEAPGPAAPPSATGTKAANITPLRPEPKVFHGYTLTKDITFRDVCYAIRDNAFLATDLPVIVSLEVHACHEQQETMVEIMNEAWKGLLVDLEGPRAVSEVGKGLPSPAQLRKKILIKVKWAPPEGQDKEEQEQEEEEDYQASAAAENDKNAPLSKSGTNISDPPKPKKPAKIIHALSRLGVYTQAYRFNNFTQPEAQIPTHIFSLSEAAVKDRHEDARQDLFNHNKEFLMRTYPSGMRVNSSNLDPSFFWRQGIQMVALNWQSWDKAMMLNEAMFAGEEGWALKPPGYRTTITGTTDVGSDSDNAIKHHDLDLSIQFFAGQNLPLPIGDANAKGFRPYVTCQLHVERPEDSIRVDKDGSDGSKRGGGDGKNSSKYKMRVKTSSGVDPDFKAEKLQFATAPGIVEELSFLRSVSSRISRLLLSPSPLVVGWVCASSVETPCSMIA
ncbi:hypothetical protein FQN54_009178 [Arachnomyces sp. PD_36]|nr:hypothetical protein FQN54_009178 [Arachnomyces sp. PD_36]